MEHDQLNPSEAHYFQVNTSEMAYGGVRYQPRARNFGAMAGNLDQHYTNPYHSLHSQQYYTSNVAPYGKPRASTHSDLHAPARAHLYAQRHAPRYDSRFIQPHFAKFALPQGSLYQGFNGQQRRRKTVFFGNTPGFYRHGCWYNAQMSHPSAPQQIVRQPENYEMPVQASQPMITNVQQPSHPVANNIQPLGSYIMPEQLQIHQQGQAPLPSPSLPTVANQYQQPGVYVLVQKPQMPQPVLASPSPMPFQSVANNHKSLEVYMMPEQSQVHQQALATPEPISFQHPANDPQPLGVYKMPEHQQQIPQQVQTEPDSHEVPVNHSLAMSVQPLVHQQALATPQPISFQPPANNPQPLGVYMMPQPPQQIHQQVQTHPASQEVPVTYSLVMPQQPQVHQQALATPQPILIQPLDNNPQPLGVYMMPQQQQPASYKIPVTHSLAHAQQEPQVVEIILGSHVRVTRTRDRLILDSRPQNMMYTVIENHNPVYGSMARTSEVVQDMAQPIMINQPDMFQDPNMTHKLENPMATEAFVQDPNLTDQSDADVTVVEAEVDADDPSLAVMLHNATQDELPHPEPNNVIMINEEELHQAKTVEYMGNEGPIVEQKLEATPIKQQNSNFNIIPTTEKITDQLEVVDQLADPVTRSIEKVSIASLLPEQILPSPIIVPQENKSIIPDPLAGTVAQPTELANSQPIAKSHATSPMAEQILQTPVKISHESKSIIAESLSGANALPPLTADNQLIEEDHITANSVSQPFNKALCPLPEKILPTPKNVSRKNKLHIADPLTDPVAQPPENSASQPFKKARISSPLPEEILPTPKYVPRKNKLHIADSPAGLVAQPPANLTSQTSNKARITGTLPKQIPPTADPQATPVAQPSAYSTSQPIKKARITSPPPEETPPTSKNVPRKNKLDIADPPADPVVQLPANSPIKKARITSPLPEKTIPSPAKVSREDQLHFANLLADLATQSSTMSNSKPNEPATSKRVPHEENIPQLPSTSATLAKPTKADDIIPSRPIEKSEESPKVPIPHDLMLNKSQWPALGTRIHTKPESARLIVKPRKNVPKSGPKIMLNVDKEVPVIESKRIVPGNIEVKKENSPKSKTKVKNVLPLPQVSPIQVKELKKDISSHPRDKKSLANNILKSPPNQKSVITNENDVPRNSKDKVKLPLTDPIVQKSNKSTLNKSSHTGDKKPLESNTLRSPSNNKSVITKYNNVPKNTQDKSKSRATDLLLRKSNKFTLLEDSDTYSTDDEMEIDPQLDTRKIGVDPKKTVNSRKLKRRFRKQETARMNEIKSKKLAAKEAKRTQKAIEKAKHLKISTNNLPSSSEPDSVDPKASSSKPPPTTTTSKDIKIDPPNCIYLLNRMMRDSGNRHPFIDGLPKILSEIIDPVKESKPSRRAAKLPPPGFLHCVPYASLPIPDSCIRRHNSNRTWPIYGLKSSRSQKPEVNIQRPPNQGNLVNILQDSLGLERHNQVLERLKAKSLAISPYVPRPKPTISKVKNLPELSMKACQEMDTSESIVASIPVGLDDLGASGVNKEVKAVSVTKGSASVGHYRNLNRLVYGTNRIPAICAGHQGKCDLAERIFWVQSGRVQRRYRPFLRAQELKRLVQDNELVVIPK